MDISTTTLKQTTAAQTARPSPTVLIDQMGHLDFSHLLKGLDLNNDGQISDQEFDTYRAGKTARGEFSAAEGPANQNLNKIPAREVTEALFHQTLEKI